MTKEQFLEGVANWDNHRHLLWEALEKTTGEVVEMGMGQGSTPFLHWYCADNKRRLFSYENSYEYARLFTNLHDKNHEIRLIENWDDVFNEHKIPDVVLIDHAPGERRVIDIMKFASFAKIIVAHDTEPAADHGYQMSKAWPLFKYRKDFTSPGAWATMVSNFVKL